VIGGDGTISACARCLIGEDIALGIIPYGSANGMARELELSDNPDEALDDFLKSRHYRQLDLYQVNDRYTGLHIGDIGLNARIVEGFEQEEGRGMFSYAKHFLRELSQSELIEFKIEVEDRTLKEEAYMVAFANARKYGTGVVLNWKGNLFDGKIELVIAKDIKIRTLLLAGMTTFNDEFSRDESSEIISFQEARITTGKPVSVQVDGEFIGKLDELKIDVLSGAVKLVLVNR
jgi:diacylglycerol kinase family enzyme